MRRRLTDQRALVTGASSGIGRALSLELARHGARLVLVARRADRLAEVAEQVSRLGGHAEVVAGDITDPDVRHRAVKTARDSFGGLDILVNNAGVGAHGRFIDASPDRLRPVMEVNFFAPVELIREALPLLREGRQPVIVNVGSILGKRACPHLGEYSASKFALHGFSEAIRSELSALGIDVLLVAAGPTDTELYDHLLERKGDLPLAGLRRHKPEKAAAQIVRAIRRGRHELVTTWRGRLLVTANRWFPRIVDRVMARYG